MKKPGPPSAPPPPNRRPGSPTRPAVSPAAAQNPSAAASSSPAKSGRPRRSVDFVDDESKSSSSWVGSLEEAAEEGRARSLSFDDLYALAPAQDGLTPQSKFAFTPLDADQAIRKSASQDDLYGLLNELAEDPLIAGQMEGGEIEDFDDGASDMRSASVMSAPMPPAPGEAVDMRRAASMTDAAEVPEMPPPPQRRATRKGPRRREVAGEEGSGEHEGRAGTGAGQEAYSPAARLFGRKRAEELRQRIMRGRDVRPEVAEEALNAATAAMMGSEGGDAIEFITWFSVWLLIMFYLLFYSSYGPMLWKFLYGPMGLILALPFGFAVLFWLVAYVFSDADD